MVNSNRFCYPPGIPNIHTRPQSRLKPTPSSRPQRFQHVYCAKRSKCGTPTWCTVLFNDASIIANGKFVDIQYSSRWVGKVRKYSESCLSANDPTDGLLINNIVSGLKSRWESVLSMEIAVHKETGVSHQEVSAFHLVWPYSISAIHLLSCSNCSG